MALLRLAMYSVSFQLDDGTEVAMRVPQDQVDTFVRILMLNGITTFSASVED
jgi:hypothetical protein